MRLQPPAPVSTPPAPLPRAVPRVRGRGRPGEVRLVQGRGQAPGPGPGQLWTSRDAKSGLTRGGYVADAGGPEAAPRPAEVPGPGRAGSCPGGNASPPARPSPQRPPAADAVARRRLRARSRSLRAPAAHARSAPSRRDVAVAVGACARGPKGGGLPRPVPMTTSVRIPPGAVRGGVHRAPFCLSQTTWLPRVPERRTSWHLGWREQHDCAAPGVGGSPPWGLAVEPGWGPGSRHQRGAFEEVWGVRRSSISLRHLYGLWSCQFLALRLRGRPGSRAKQGHLLPFYN